MFLRKLPLSSLKTLSTHKTQHFTFRQMSGSEFDRFTGKAVDLLKNSITTEDDQPDQLGPSKKRKPRHPPKPPSTEPGVDLSGSSVLLFPGQGAQFVGMGAKLLEIPSVKELYDEASQILDYDLLKLCLEGPKSLLDETQYCQAATVVTSLAAVELLYHQQEGVVENCLAVAGFSVGELTAAIFTGALTLSEGINLVKVRAEAMQAASDMCNSGMMTVFMGADSELGFACKVAGEWCRRHHDIEDPVCQVANHLYAGAKVLGGHELALQFIEQNKADFKIRKTMRLPVSGAFHTPLMFPAVEPFAQALQNTRVNDPRVPIYSNYDNRVITKGKQLQKYLPRQLVTSVKWESAMAKLFVSGPDDIPPRVFECGPGRGLSAMLGKINGKAAKKCRYIPV
eukprot:GFUD01013973.1.p1 GENE.GFUD01013973.1~~GFUD01013973.1.p1  ORF type:complete len:397 (+),score=87.30 GFUD01013973.1:57-1247(+)